MKPILGGALALSVLAGGVASAQDYYQYQGPPTTYYQPQPRPYGYAPAYRPAPVYRHHEYRRYYTYRRPLHRVCWWRYGYRACRWVR